MAHAAMLAIFHSQFHPHPSLSLRLVCPRATATCLVLLELGFAFPSPHWEPEGCWPLSTPCPLMASRLLFSLHFPICNPIAITTTLSLGIRIRIHIHIYRYACIMVDEGRVLTKVNGQNFAFVDCMH